METTDKKLTRIEVFARFFKKFMGVSTMVTAALPIPVTALRFIPTYSFQTKMLSVYTSLFCFLTFAFVFYSRDKVAGILFPEFSGSFKTTSGIFASVWGMMMRLLPVGLIAASVFCVFSYQRLLSNSIFYKRAAFGLPASEVTDAAILEKSFMSQTPEANWLMIFYLGIFVMAESAFVVMALKEHLQDSLLLSEIELLRGTRRLEPKDDTLARS